MSLDLVSVVMPNYNGGAFLREAALSVLGQTHKNLELIIFDDCSSDDSLSSIADIELSDVRVKVLGLSENSGAAKSRNTAISISRGSFLAFLDSDDLWYENKLSHQIDAIRCC